MRNPSRSRSPFRTAAPVVAVCLALACTSVRASTPGPSPEASPAKTVRNRDTVVAKGVEITFSANPLDPSSPEPREGEYAEVSFSIRDVATGSPVPSLYPGAWMDMAHGSVGGGDPLTCREKVEQYLRGGLNYRPLLDLTAYYLLVMNNDASISVIDPVLGLRGITHLYTMVLLQSPGEDWIKSRDGRTLFVSMPRVGKVAAVDTDSFRVAKDIEAGSRPVRTALQPDGKYLWVGNDAGTAGESGLTVIDTGDRKVAARIPTGAGHHEIAFSDDGRFVFATNLAAGTVSVIDARTLAKVRDVATGPAPAALAWSPLAKALYIADGREGTITVLDGSSHRQVARIAAAPGLNAIGFAPGGRYAFALSGTGNKAFVADASTNRVVHVFDLEAHPYQVQFTDAFAYLRCRDSEQVTMVSLQALGMEGNPDVKKFAAGTRAPGRDVPVGVAGTVTRAVGEAAVVVANAAENSLYYYMEGMTAPMGSFRNYGHELKAVEVVDRSLKERAPGVYSTTVKIPIGGTYDVAFFLDAPTVIHCFRMEAGESASGKKGPGPVRVEYLMESASIRKGEAGHVRFRLSGPASNAPRTDLSDVLVRITQATGRWQGTARAEHRGDGVYEVTFPPPPPGVYVVTVECASLHVRPDQLPPFTIQVVEGGAPIPAGRTK
ncbi:MAG: YncE family protein [Deltaproteobacteria bacterium]|nr:cytochrome D1 domain-containing protein [Candidatus Deferrimicrobiaceae bacterium]